MSVAATPVSSTESAAAAGVWRLPPDLQHSHLRDKGAELLAEPPTSLTIDIRGFKRCEPTAEPHLLDVVTLAQRLGAPMRLLVQSTSVPGSDAVASRYERLFTRRLAGFFLAELAFEIRDEQGRDHKPAIEALVRAALEEGKGLVRQGQQRAAPIAFDSGFPVAEVVLEDDPKRVRQLILNELRELGLSTFKPIVLDVANCVHEAIENVRLHSAKQLPTAQSRSFGFVAMRRILRSDLPRLSRTSASPQREYYERHLGSSGAERHLELTVADNGSGIAATMAGTRQVYDEATDRHGELGQVALALGRGSSIRSSNQGRGLGLPQMLDAVARRQGLMIVRSGRIRGHAQRLPNGSHELTSVRPLAYPVGTTIVFVFPEPMGRREA